MTSNNRREAAINAAKSGTMTQRQIWIVLIGLMSGMFLAALDQSVVATGMRTIADDLDGLALQAWATTAYLITSTISTPIYGKLGDIFGRRPLFITAIAIFVLGSLTTGLATSMLELAAFRALQGVGAGGLFSLALTILADIVPPRERARYQGVFLAVFGTSSVMGPLVGGLFAGIDEILWIDGWRWIFLINLPIGALSMFMVVRFLHVPHNPRPSRIDWLGASAIILAVVPILLVAEQGREWGWGSWISIGMYALAGIGIISFIAIERRMGEEALIPLSLFRNQTFARTTIFGVFMGFGMFGGMIILPLVIQVVYGVTPTQAGLLMLPMVGGMMTASIVAGRLTSKTGKWRIFMNTGTALMFAGYLYLFLVVSAETPIWMMSIGMVAVGLGLGQLMQTHTVASQNAAEPRNIGVATSTATFTRQMGGTLGVTVLLSILFGQVKDKITLAYQQPDVQQGIAEALADPVVLTDASNSSILALMDAGDGSAVDSVLTDSSFLIGVDERLSAPFQIGFAEASTTTFLISACVIAIAFLISWTIKEIPLRSKSASHEAADLRDPGL